jgi:hypothetical protein
VSFGDGMSDANAMEAFENTSGSAKFAWTGVLTLRCTRDDIDANNASSRTGTTFDDKRGSPMAVVERPSADGDGSASSKCSSNHQPIDLLGHFFDCPRKFWWSKMGNFHNDSQGDPMGWHQPV